MPLRPRRQQGYPHLVRVLQWCQWGSVEPGQVCRRQMLNQGMGLLTVPLAGHRAGAKRGVTLVLRGALRCVADEPGLPAKIVYAIGQIGDRFRRFPAIHRYRGEYVG